MLILADDSSKQRLPKTVSDWTDCEYVNRTRPQAFLTTVKPEGFILQNPAMLWQYFVTELKGNIH